MSNKKVVLGTTLTSIAEAIRSKLGVTTKYKPSEMADAIESITTGIDVSDTTATQSDVKTGKSFYDSDGVKVEGNMRNISSSDFSAVWSQNKYTVSCDYSGYLNGYSIYTTLDTVPNPDVLWMMPYEILPQYTRAYFPYGGIYVSNSDFEDKTPLPTPQSVSTNKVYYFDRNGYVIDAYSDVTPSASGVEVSSGMKNIESDGYLYSERPSSGTDVSDTTATASDVLSGKYFYNSAGTKTNGSLSITSITPSNSSPVSLSSGNNYKASGSGYAISSYSTASGSTDGTQLTSGSFYKISGSPYLYSTKPSSGGKGGTITGIASGETITINTGLTDLKGICIIGTCNSSSYQQVIVLNPTNINNRQYWSAVKGQSSTLGTFSFNTQVTSGYWTYVTNVSNGIVTLKNDTHTNWAWNSLTWFAS